MNNDSKDYKEKGTYNSNCENDDSNNTNETTRKGISI
jgi:hypothetical protein